MEEICAVLQGLDWSPLYISLKTGAVVCLLENDVCNLLFSGVIRSQEGDQGGSENKGCGGWAAYASHGAATYSGGLLPSSSVQQKKAAWHVPV